MCKLYFDAICENLILMLANSYSVDFNTFRVKMFYTFREPKFFTFSVIFSHIASIFTFSVEFFSHLATF